ncbi:hypothetical protein GS504_01035 [Rhodococcus hoagii]|nr:hypothetical protein [Prescottella equi]NKS71744.1 hypothetical protein [Prescottella equi]
MAQSVWRKLTHLGLSVDEIADWSAASVGIPADRVARIAAAGFTPAQLQAGDTAGLTDETLETMALARKIAEAEA